MPLGKGKPAPGAGLRPAPGLRITQGDNWANATSRFPTPPGITHLDEGNRTGETNPDSLALEERGWLRVIRDSNGPWPAHEGRFSPVSHGQRETGARWTLTDGNARAGSSGHAVPRRA